MDFMTCKILEIIFKSAKASFTFKTSSMVESKAKQKDFKFFYFYGVKKDDMTVSTISLLQKEFKDFYPHIHCNITQNKHGLTVWVSDNLKYDALMANQIN